MKPKKTTDDMRREVEMLEREVTRPRAEFADAIRSTRGVQYVREFENAAGAAIAAHKRALGALKRREKKEARE